MMFPEEINEAAEILTGLIDIYGDEPSRRVQRREDEWYWECRYCGGNQEYRQGGFMRFKHHDTCPVLHAREWLSRWRP